MKKQIIIISENGKDEEFANFANQILEDTEYEALCNVEADINNHEAVVFVFDKKPHNNCDMLNSWTGHSHLRCVWGNTEKEKSDMLKKELMHIAGIPVPLEIEHKFLIELPDEKMLCNMPNCKAVEIEQVYLSPIDGSHIRIRRRSANDKTIFIKTEKKKISNSVRIEIEGEISHEEYDNLMQYADKGLSPVTKTRYCLMDMGKYFEIDVFPFWKDRAYLEIELTDEAEKYHIPEFIEVIKEVTEDRRYTNRSLAKYIKLDKTGEL